MAIIARLKALENDYTGMETVEAVDDDEASLDNDDDGIRSIYKRSRKAQRKTRQAKALENARKALSNFLELLQEAILEALPPHFPSFMRAAMGPPSSTAAGISTLFVGSLPIIHARSVDCAFVQSDDKKIHDDTHYLKFVA
ncbi:hypothetical protein OIU85_028189 [Salix viminalis]|uniref:Uncharacterized protein n=1 Tax=Salix viminalis TaxID=40686 RepID=A0A9Q0QJZ7_SALVM|nr:hypothetical protein OIU85_028189 [Salix viminalis]